MNVPKLRFTEFRDVWFEIRLGDECDVRDGTHDSPKYVEKGFPLVTSKNLMDGEIDLENVSFISVEDYEKINQRSKVNVGDIIFGMIGTIGNPVLLKSNQFAIKNVALFKEKISSRIKNIYLIQYLNSNSFIKVTNYLHAGNTQKFVSLGALRGLEFQIPSLIEQTKIATFLSAVDEKIAQLSRKHELLQQYKQGMMQQLFSQKLRFKDDKGEDFPEWEKLNASEIFENYSNKNHDRNLTILAATQDKGIIPREQIEIDIKTSDASIKSYKKIEIGNFVISLRSFQGGIEYSNYSGICSPAYTVLKSIKPINDEFYKNYLKTHDFIQKLNATVIGIRDGKQISYQAFSDLILDYPPSLKEQAKIANFLTAIDNKIEAVAKQLEQARVWKQGLLQQMFV